MTAILKARVDLLWFGGIGTYIRASGESDDQVGDRANDQIRVAGADVRARVIGEGANLGATQRGRVEAAQKGIKLNTDAIDNSAGVNTSDVEVNLKIALARPERDGRLSRNDRNSLLVAMTDEVGTLVVRNNYLQTLALSLTERKGLAETGFLTRLMQSLEQRYHQRGRIVIREADRTWWRVIAGESSSLYDATLLAASLRSGYPGAFVVRMD